jgi:hypothetical protein
LLGIAVTAVTAAACTGGGGTPQPVSTAPGITRTLGGTVPSGTSAPGSTTGFIAVSGA